MNPNTTTTTTATTLCGTSTSAHPTTTTVTNSSSTSLSSSSSPSATTTTTNNNNLNAIPSPTTKRKRTKGYIKNKTNCQQQQQQQQQQDSTSTSSHFQPQTLSRALAWALRHHAQKLQFTMTPDGYVPIVEIIQCTHPKLSGYTQEQIEYVVQNNDKQRFALQQKSAQDYIQSPYITGNEGIIWCIRANQGHSMNIPTTTTGTSTTTTTTNNNTTLLDPNQLFTQLTPQQLKTIPCIVHGTYIDAWKQIQKLGYLSRMKRQYIHFAKGIPSRPLLEPTNQIHSLDIPHSTTTTTTATTTTTTHIISGIRPSCQIYIYIDPIKCANDGIIFYESTNGVLLTSGETTTTSTQHKEGTLSLDYVLRVVTKTGEILMDPSKETHIHIHRERNHETHVKNPRAMV